MTAPVFARIEMRIFSAVVRFGMYMPDIRARGGNFFLPIILFAVRLKEAAVLNV